eukprot:259261_1
MAYLYLLDYIYLYKFHRNSWRVIHRMYSMLARLVFSGTTLCCGSMMEMLSTKYGRCGSMQLIETNTNLKFYEAMGVMFGYLYHFHHKHLPNKPILVLQQTIYDLHQTVACYTNVWRRPKIWIQNSPDNAVYIPFELCCNHYHICMKK